MIYMTSNEDIINEDASNELYEFLDITTGNDDEEELLILQDKDPLSFIHTYCQILKSDQSQTLKIITLITATIKRADTFWLSNKNAQDEMQKNDQRNSIKETLLRFMNAGNEQIYASAALSLFIVGSLEFKNNEWPSFFNDIFSIIKNVIDQLQYQEQINDKEDKSILMVSSLQIQPAILGALDIIKYSLEENILTTDYRFFDQYMHNICYIFKYFIQKYDQDENDDIKFAYNEKSFFLYKTRERCFHLLEVTMQYLSNEIKTYEQCSDLVQLLLEADSQFISDIYETLGLLYKYYYSIASPKNSANICIKAIFEFSMKDLSKENSNNIRKICALNFWINMANIELDMLKNERKMELCYYTLGVYEHIRPKILAILDQICSSGNIYESDLQETAIECLSCFVKTEPQTIFPDISDFFKKHIKKSESDSSHYQALTVLSTIIKKCQFSFISEFLILILECAENKNNNEKLDMVSLKLIAKIIKYFPNSLSLSNISDIISMCEKKLENKETFQIISRLIKLFDISMNSTNSCQGIIDFRSKHDYALELNAKITQLVTNAAERNISLSYSAIISLIQISNDPAFLISFLNSMINKFQDINKDDTQDISALVSEDGYIINSDLCQILRNCINRLKNLEENQNFDQLTKQQIEALIQRLKDSVLEKFCQSYDDDLLELVCSFISKSTDFEFISNLMPIVMNTFFSTGNTQRITIAAEFISDLVTAKLAFVGLDFLNEYKLFDVYEEILNNQATLKSIHSPIITSLADIINSFGRESFEIRQKFMPIFAKFVNIPIDPSKANDIEYAYDLFEALCRVYTAITNFIDDSGGDVINICDIVFKLFKRIYQFELYQNNTLILQFVVCIIHNLYNLSESKNRITFLANNKSVKEMLMKAASFPKQKEECRKRAQLIVHFLYSNY